MMNNNPSYNNPKGCLNLIFIAAVALIFCLALFLFPIYYVYWQEKIGEGEFVRAKWKRRIFRENIQEQIEELNGQTQMLMPKGRRE
tara:strand:- start:150 stop:407 length:258 start_codon:yes stop_codon:yes gene_type:complete